MREPSSLNSINAKRMAELGSPHTLQSMIWPQSAKCWATSASVTCKTNITGLCQLLGAIDGENSSAFQEGSHAGKMQSIHSVRLMRMVCLGSNVADVDGAPDVVEISHCFLLGASLAPENSG